MTPGPSPSLRPLEPVGDPAVLLVHSAQRGRIVVELVHASPAQRRALEPFVRFLRTLPKPPPPERISLTLADPTLLGLLLTGRLFVGGLDVVERLVGLQVLLPDDRWGASGLVAEWIARFRDRLRERLARPRGR